MDHIISGYFLFIGWITLYLWYSLCRIDHIISGLWACLLQYRYFFEVYCEIGWNFKFFKARTQYLIQPWNISHNTWQRMMLSKQDESCNIIKREDAHALLLLLDAEIPCSYHPLGVPEIPFFFWEHYLMIESRGYAIRALKRGWKNMEVTQSKWNMFKIY